MPIQYTIDQTRHQVETTVSGSVTVDDILGHWEAVRREGGTEVQGTDRRTWGEEAFSFPEGHLEPAASVRAARCEETFGPRAVIVASDLIFGLTRIFTSLVSDHLPIRVFREQARAEVWLREWKGLVESP